MYDDDKLSLSDVVRRDIKNWAGIIENYFEQNTAAHVLAKAALFGFSLFSALADATVLAETYWAPLTSKGFLLSVIAMLLIIDAAHVFIAQKRALKINRGKRLVRNMTNIIRDASGLNAPAYNIVDWFIEHDISSNGDCRYTRAMEIKYINDTVYWVRVPIGVIDGNTEDRTEDTGLTITNPNDGGTLPFVVVDDNAKKKDLVILLEPPARLNQNAKLRMTLLWRGAYTPLIRNNIDHGKITVQHFTSLITIKFIAPQNFSFTNIRMINELGKFEIKDRDDGRSVLIWKCTDLPRGEYTYSLISKKKEPQ